MRAMRRRVFAYDVHAWSAGFLDALATAGPVRGVRTSSVVD
jgi:hypothetical protein